MKTVARFILPALLLYIVMSCSAEDQPDPDKGGSLSSPPKTLHRTDTDNTYRLDYDNEGRLIRTTITTGNYAGQYNYWDYSSGKIEHGYVIPPATKKTAMSVYNLKDGLVIEKSQGPEWVISGSSIRNFNHTYDIDRHLTSYEMEIRKLSNNTLESHYRYDLEWKDGNMVRLISFDKLNNKAAGDITCIYDLSHLNTLSYGSQAIGIYHTPIEPLFDLQFEGKGTKNPIVSTHRTGGTPPTRPRWSYTYDDKGRITSITQGTYGTVTLTY